ncbi:hypothetical protein NHX12_034411 [Muraenolepis orangiensis]|uniref:B30.2/SPRY domain-containing protein n=1 Tax=Muraenolepis orangiensis TaxID=630683 RepID=A0A9Q0I4B3_9TELE|nr:hypothetical protein NHX12_034411 [Muraenolepis orangiensis]
MSGDPSGPEPEDFTLDESKLIIREIAQELDRILQVGPAVVRLWKWITKTTDKVRLDPSTANPCLEISDDMTAMKMYQIVEKDWNPWDNFERDRQKFDGWWCVLGNEGFVSGKHYWEVDVQGKEEWRLGVVSESAPRNGFQSLNETTGYWTLKLQLGQLMAMTFPVTKLDRCAPRVLGMFLDMEEGQMSFYDVDHRFHIYSFNVNFNRNKKVFPVFGTVETRERCASWDELHSSL